MGVLTKSLHFISLVLFYIHKAIVKIASKHWYLQLNNNQKEKDSHHTQEEAIHTFSDIPGPWPSLPVIGTQWIYSWLGPYKLSELHLANEDKFKKYGPIVKEYGLWNYPILHLYDKKDIENVLRYPSKFPIRPTLEAQCVYRKSRPDRYNSVGLVNVQGEEWHTLRRKLTSPLTSPQLNKEAIKQIDEISEELRDSLYQEGNGSYTVDMFEKYMCRFGLEVMIAVLLGRRMGCLQAGYSHMAGRLMLATDKLFQACHEAMYGLPLWKYLPSASYNVLVNCEDTIYDFFADFVKECLVSGNSSTVENISIMERMLRVENIDLRDKITTVIDLVSGGIDTTGNGIIFLLYNITRNERVKLRVHEELDRVLSPTTEITQDTLAKLPFLKACIKESMRLNPIAPNVARILEKDFVFQNYFIPCGTLVICETWVACLQEENFPSAKEFIPERWLDKDNNINRFLVAPFGAGKRMCPGKRIAELEMIIATAKLLQKFEINFVEPVEPVYKFLITPKGPIKVTIKNRFI